MAKLNKKMRARTFEGAPAKTFDAEKTLRRAVLSCLLWEDTFYEDGVTIAERIAGLAAIVPAQRVADLAIEARSSFNLRHAPLWLACALTERADGRALLADLLPAIIQRADEMPEFLAMYWRDHLGTGKQRAVKKLPNAVKRGLAKAFQKFDAYQLAKYNRQGPVSLRDVLFLTHAKPLNEEQARVWQDLIDGTLAAPDTWEVALSGGADRGC